MFDLSSGRAGMVFGCLCVRVCALKMKKRGECGGGVGGGWGVALVLSDSERMNKKLISLFQGTLAVMSETVPSQRNCASAVECVCVCLSSQWDVFRAYLTVIFTMNRYASTNANYSLCTNSLGQK